MSDDRDVKRPVTEWSCYVLAGLAVLFGIISMFFPIPAESLYWFFFALVAILLPFIRTISFKDLKIVVDDMKEAKKHIDQAKLELQEARKKFDKPREELIKCYAEYLASLPSEKERMEKREVLSRLYLDDMTRSISWVKALLKKHGYFAGEIDDDFSDEYYNALCLFQKRFKLINDGIFGYQSYWKLLDLDSTKRPVSNS